MPFRSRRDVDAELRAHLELEEAALRETGLSADEARAVAHRKFGNVGLAAEQTRDERTWRWLETACQDLRYGARLLRRSPGFAVAAALILSLGIGVNVALFSIVRSLFAPSLGVPAPEELGYFAKRIGDIGFLGNFSEREVESIHDSGQTLAAFAGQSSPRRSTMAVGDRLDYINLQFVDGRYFDVVGVSMALGRKLGTADGDPANGVPAVVIGHRLWTGVLNADPHVVGQTVLMDEQPVVIVGVARPAFRGLSDPARPVDAWTVPTDGRELGLQPVFRLHQGRQFDEMAAMVASQTPVWQRRLWERQSPDFRTRTPDFLTRRPYKVFRADTVSDPYRPEASPVPLALLAAIFTVVGLVWLIATTNVSGLLMARGISRTGELAVRRALGAGRARILRQMLTECALIAATGGAAGLLLALGLVKFFTAYAPPTFLVDVRVDWPVALMACLLAVVGGLIIGLAPALQATHVQVLAGLQSGPAAGTRTRRPVTRWILVPQVGASVALLVVAAVHTRSLFGLEFASGFETAGVQSLRVELRELEPRNWIMSFGRVAPVIRPMLEARRQRLAVYRQVLLEHATALPDVAAFGLVTQLPLPPFGLANVRPQIALREEHEAGIASHADAPVVGVSSGYFDAMRIPFLRGRTFRESGDGPREIIVSASLARALGRGRDVLGRSIAFVDPDSTAALVWFEIVGVVRDVTAMAITETTPTSTRTSRPVDSIAYASFHSDWAMGACCLVVRGRDDVLPDPEGLRRIALAADPMANVATVRPLEDLVADAHYPRRLAALVLLSAGAVGLLLAVTGVYAAVSYAARQRVREIGVRAALGATRRHLALLLVGDGAKVVVLGAILGVAGAVAALRLTASIYPDLPRVDPISLVATPLVLAAVVLVACLVPARRVARVDPATVLKAE